MSLVKLKHWGQSFLDYIFPKECFGCQSEGEYLCSACFSQLKFLSLKQCLFCRRPALGNAGICPACAKETGIARLIAATAYEKTVVGQMIEALKYNYAESLAVDLIRVMSQQIERKLLANFFSGRTLLPLPLHKKRLAERGFNQAEILARGLSLKYGSALGAGLVRIKNTAQQAKLTREERFSNIKDAFQWNLKFPVLDKVILVDDVLTSGATFLQAAKALKIAGVKEVSCLAIAHG